VLAGIVTIVSLLAFLAGVAWAYSGKRRREFDEAARLPLEDGRPGDADIGGPGPSPSEESRGDRE
jgi:cytochrome c oxidase cbb3-type subunit IV